MMAVMKQASARRAEKALREILDRTDLEDATPLNGRVPLKDFIKILETNDLKVNL